MNTLIDEFCLEWGNEETIEEFKKATIKLIHGVQRQTTNKIIRKNKLEKNLYTEFSVIMDELKEIRNDISILKISDVKKPIKKPTGSPYGIFASKIAKEMSEKNNLDPEKLVGTGTSGKVTKKDIDNYLKGGTKKCNGTKGTGSPCMKTGTQMVNDEWYCKKHIDQHDTNEDSSQPDDSQIDQEDISISIEEDLKRFREESMEKTEKIDEY
jgi:pyruvate/2-oxoglutarate dehydrogenase complex dihydrolipoamide acyltransferase (E2) component